MTYLFDLFWPAFGAGLVIGAIAATVMFRRKLRGTRQATWLAGALAIAFAASALWIGPMGAADRFTGKVERTTRLALDYYEMSRIDARLERNPLNRNLGLAGPADEFQTRELVRLMSQVPGVRRAEWNPSPTLPLWLEAMLAAVGGFLTGMFLAYLVELHRRYNAQWSW